MPEPISDEALQVAQVVRLKRRVAADELSFLAGSVAAGVVSSLIEEGSLEDQGGQVALTAAGEEARAHGIEAERERLDPVPIEAAYAEFDRHNAELKRIVTAWQLREDRDGTEPNDHSDAAYDEGVVARLRALDGEFESVLADLVARVPRLGAYGPRFATALGRIEDGDRRYLASPLLDSYHTIWFELHEELYELRGVDRRSAEAAE
jgi:pyruvate,orthophosphate dikinase